jgi:hypothetical protein
VIEQHLDGLATPAQIERFAIEADPVSLGSTVAQHGNAVVDGHAAGANPLLDAAARTMPGAGQ